MQSFFLALQKSMDDMVSHQASLKPHRIYSCVNPLVLLKYPVPQVLGLTAAVGIGQAQEFLVLQAKEFNELLVCKAKQFAVPLVPGY